MGGKSTKAPLAKDIGWEMRGFGELETQNLKNINQANYEAARPLADSLATQMANNGFSLSSYGNTVLGPNSDISRSAQGVQHYGDMSAGAGQGIYNTGLGLGDRLFAENRNAGNDTYNQGLAIGRGIYNEGRNLGDNAYNQGMAIGSDIYNQGRNIGNNAYNQGMAIGSDIYNEGRSLGNNAYNQGMAIGNNAYNQGMAIGNRVYDQGLTIGGNVYNQGLTQGADSMNRADAFIGSLGGMAGAVSQPSISLGSVQNGTTAAGGNAQDYHNEWRNVYAPAARQQLADAQNFNTAAYRENLAMQAMADAGRQFQNSQSQIQRTMGSTGMNMGSGAAAALQQQAMLANAAQRAGAGTGTRWAAEQEGWNRVNTAMNNTAGAHLIGGANDALGVEASVTNANTGAQASVANANTAAQASLAPLCATPRWPLPRQRSTPDWMPGVGTTPPGPRVC